MGVPRRVRRGRVLGCRRGVPLEPGASFGQYRIIARLGRGGMASVYKAYEAALDRYVALKVLPAEFLHEPTFAARFEREAKLIAKLEHPHIVPIYAFGIEERTPWMAMRLIAEGTVSSLFKAKPLRQDAIQTLLGVAAALDYAHGQGVVHRDVKPQNILLDAARHAYLADFGIARMLEGTAFLTRGGIVGTPHYMAPEQGQGKSVDRLCDVYSLGIVAYEMLAGRLPFDADTPLAVLMKHAMDPIPIPPVSEVPEPVTRVLLKCLAKDPAARWQTATAFTQALQGALSPAWAATAAGSEEQPPALADPTEAPTLARLTASPTSSAPPLPATRASTEPAAAARSPTASARGGLVGVAGIGLFVVAMATWLVYSRLASQEQAEPHSPPPPTLAATSPAPTSPPPSPLTAESLTPAPATAEPPTTIPPSRAPATPVPPTTAPPSPTTIASPAPTPAPTPEPTLTAAGAETTGPGPMRVSTPPRRTFGPVGRVPAGTEFHVSVVARAETTGLRLLRCANETCRGYLRVKSWPPEAMADGDELVWRVDTPDRYYFWAENAHTGESLFAKSAEERGGKLRVSFATGAVFDSWYVSRLSESSPSASPPTSTLPPRLVGGVAGGLPVAPPPPPPASPRPSPSPGAFRVGGRIPAPKKLHDVRAVYPEMARQARVQGVVVVECTVSPEGRVTGARVTRSVPLLDAAALAAVSQWEFEPTLVDGVAVPVIMTSTVSFSLR